MTPTGKPWVRSAIRPRSVSAAAVAAGIWDIIGPQIELVMAGKGATWNEDQLVPVDSPRQA